MQSACLYFCYCKDLKPLIPAHLQKNKRCLSSFSGLGMDFNISIVHISLQSMM